MSTVLDEVILEDRLDVDLSVLAASLRTEREETITLAIDIGSSGARASLFGGRGDEIKGSQISLSHDFSELSSGLDADVEALLSFTERAIDVAVARAENFVSRIDYVASCCFWHSLVGVNAQARAVTPLFSWAETRAAGFVDQLRSQFDEAETHPRTGARFHPSYWPAKLLWLKTDRPDQFRKTKRWLSFSDYLLLKLFGDDTTSVSMASATGLFNQQKCEWDADLLNGIGISIEQLPDVAGPGKTFTSLTEDYAARWPLLDRAAWFPAIGDGAANNIGAGCVTSNRATLMIGTSGAMRVLFSGSLPQRLPRELFSYRVDRDRTVIGGALSDGGGLIQWVRETLNLDFEFDDLDAKLGAFEPDSHGLTVLPFWSGERATGWTAATTGSIIGLTARTKPIAILRATMEAICYRFALIARAIERVAPGATIVAAGNALLSSPVWLQMLADVLGRQIETSSVNEASLRGAALLALEAIGKIDSIETIDSPCGEIYEPDFARQEIYARAIERQQKLYEKLIYGF